MVWANFDTENFFASYMINYNKGHEMINEFINYYNNDQSIFAKENGAYTEFNSSVYKEDGVYKGKNGGRLDLSYIEKMGVGCNTIVSENYNGIWTIDSSFFIDDIKAVNKDGEKISQLIGSKLRINGITFKMMVL